MVIDWDPTKIGNAAFDPRCLKRIQRDISNITNNAPEGIFALPDEDNLRLITVLITGPKDTSYHGGMFRYLVGFPDDYPIKPPMVKCLTSSESNTQLHPHIYSNGFVCLSILGTFTGPSWSAAMTLTGAILSVQSLLADKPYHEMRVYNLKREDAKKVYDTIIQHEVIRIAVIDVMEKKATFPELFAEKLDKIFIENYEHYVKVCNENMHLDGNTAKYPFYKEALVYQYRNLLDKLENLKAKMSTSL